MKKIILFFAVFFLVFNCFSANLPDTPAGNRAKEIIELLNDTGSYDPDDYIKNQYAPAFREAFPLASHKAIFQTTKTMFGKLKVVDIRKAAEYEINLVLKSETKDAWLNLVLQVEQETPHRVLSIGLMPGARPENSEAVSEKSQTQLKDYEDKTQDHSTQLFSNFV